MSISPEVALAIVAGSYVAVGGGFVAWDAITGRQIQKEIQKEKKRENELLISEGRGTVIEIITHLPDGSLLESCPVSVSLPESGRIITRVMDAENLNRMDLIRGQEVSFHIIEGEVGEGKRVGLEPLIIE